MTEQCHSSSKRTTQDDLTRCIRNCFSTVALILTSVCPEAGLCSSVKSDYVVCSPGKGCGALQCGVQHCAESLGSCSPSMAMWSFWEVVAESSFAQVRSLTGVVLENVINEGVYDGHDFRREPVLGWTCSSSSIRGWSSSASCCCASCHLSPACYSLGLEGAWLSQVFT